MKVSLQQRNILSRWVSIGVVASGILALYLTMNAYSNPYLEYPSGTINYAMQNWGVALIVLEAVLAYLLKWMQQGAYWFFWLQLKKVNLDERQKAVRQRVFEKAYAFALIISLAVAIFFSSSLAEYGSQVRNEVAVRVIWIVGIGLISLPSILAAWQKDSQ